MTKSKYRPRTSEEIEYNRKKVMRETNEAIKNGTHSIGVFCPSCGEKRNGIWRAIDRGVGFAPVNQCIYCAARDGCEDAIKALAKDKLQIPDF